MLLVYKKSFNVLKSITVFLNFLKQLSIFLHELFSVIISYKSLIFLGISGIPTLIVCKKDGTVVTKDGRTNVMGTPPAQAVKAWKS